MWYKMRLKVNGKEVETYRFYSGRSRRTNVRADGLKWGLAEMEEEREEVLKRIKAELNCEQVQEPPLEWLRQRLEEAKWEHSLLGTEIWIIKSLISKMTDEGGELTNQL
jgi:hypothetical protein